MDNAQAGTKAHLMQTSPEFRQLVDQHHEYDRQVEQLEAKAFLNEEETVEEQRLKKLKLHLKDQMESMLLQGR